MIERNVAYHKWHVVSGPVGGTVTNEDGTVTYCTIPDGGQGHFFAVTTKVWVSEETVELDQDVNFKGAGAKLRLLGAGVNALPAGYLQAEFLESTAGFGSMNQKIKLPAIFDLSADSITIETRHSNGFYNGALSVEGSNTLGYGLNYNGNPVFFINGENVSGKTLDKVTANLEHVWRVESTPNKQEMLMNGETFAEVAKAFTAGAVDFGLFGMDTGARVFRGRKKYWTLDVNGKRVMNLTPAINVAGRPCMCDKVSKVSHLPATAVDFIAGFTLAQARKLGKHLPATGGSLTVSLPWEAKLVQYNAEIEASLQTAKSKGWTITVQYREPEEDSKEYNKYAACTSNEEMAAINADYRNDVDKDGVWAWNLPNMVKFDVRYGGDYLTAGVSGATKIKHLKLVLPKCTSMDSAVRSVKKLIETVDIYAPALTAFPGTFYDSVAKKYILHAPKVTKINALLGWCPNVRELGGNFDGLQTATNWFSNYGTPPPFTTVTCGFPSLKSGSGMFSSVQLNKDSALLVLGSIPAWTDGASHPLAIGIHVDHQSDEEVIEAIAAAEKKGWTLSVQWNGTATAAAASTYGLRRNPVYAKLGEAMDDGKQYLDWGHYVTNWEEHGYMEFASLEEAQEYFNIGE